MKTVELKPVKWMTIACLGVLFSGCLMGGNKAADEGDGAPVGSLDGNVHFWARLTAVADGNLEFDFGSCPGKANRVPYEIQGDTLRLRDPQIFTDMEAFHEWMTEQGAERAEEIAGILDSLMGNGNLEAYFDFIDSVYPGSLWDTIPGFDVYARDGEGTGLYGTWRFVGSRPEKPGERDDMFEEDGFISQGEQLEISSDKILWAYPSAHIYSLRYAELDLQGDDDVSFTYVGKDSVRIVRDGEAVGIKFKPFEFFRATSSAGRPKIEMALDSCNTLSAPDSLIDRTWVHEFMHGWEGDLEDEERLEKKAFAAPRRLPSPQRGWRKLLRER